LHGDGSDAIPSGRVGAVTRDALTRYALLSAPVRVRR